MTTIKKYWKWLVAGIAALFGIFILFNTKRNTNKAVKLDNKIKKNDAEINKLDGKVEQVQEQRAEVVEKIETVKTDIETLEQQKQEVNPEVRDVADAKENILNKTKRRGRKPKSAK